MALALKALKGGEPKSVGSQKVSGLFLGRPENDTSALREAPSIDDEQGHPHLGRCGFQFVIKRGNRDPPPQRVRQSCQQGMALA